MNVESSFSGEPVTTHPFIGTKPRRLILLETVDSTTLAAIAFFFGVAVVLAYRPLSQVEVGDPAVYDYIAQSILRGQVPYRDIVDIKSPGAAYLSATAMALGNLAGLRDVIAVRLLHVVLAGLLTAATCLVAEIYLRNRLVTVMAFMIPLMPEHFAMMIISGTQPKLPMILFGMITLVLIGKDRPFWAGVCSMLSALCWQPGLLFTGTAFLISSRYLTSWTDRRAIKVLLGAAIPLLVVLGYFHWKGALGDMWAWTVTYNYQVFGPEAKKGAGDAIQSLWTIILRVFRPDVVAPGNSALDGLMFRFAIFAGLATLAMVPASLIGLLLFGRDRLRAKLSGIRPPQSPDLFVDALFIPPAVYLAFCLINFQAGPDLIPFFPFIGIFAGLLVVKAGGGVSTLRWVKTTRWPLALARVVPLSALALILLILLARTVTYKPDDWTLRDQDHEFKVISDLLGPGDKIYVHGRVELLVLLNRPNLNPYILLDWGADDFAAARNRGGWSAIMDEMEARKPRVVAISRLRAVAHRAEIERWVDEHYDPLTSFRYDRVFVRKPE
jgi:hypothetical protein